MALLLAFISTSTISYSNFLQHIRSSLANDTTAGKNIIIIIVTTISHCCTYTRVVLRIECVMNVLLFLFFNNNKKKQFCQYYMCLCVCCALYNMYSDNNGYNIVGRFETNKLIDILCTQSTERMVAR